MSEERRQKGGRKKYVEDKVDFLRIGAMDEDKLCGVIGNIEGDPDMKEFLNHLISKPTISFEKVNPTMLMKIEHDTGIIIEPTTGWLEITEDEAKRRTLKKFFDRHKWLELNSHKIRESITKWFLIYRRAANIEEGQPNEGKRVQISADGTINIV